MGAEVQYGPPPTPNRRKWPYEASATFQGMKIYVENMPGSVRQGKGPDGTPWATKMKAAYGEFAGTLGNDGDPVDVYIGPDADAPNAYVVHQKHPGTEVFDEDKVVVGCNSLAEARKLYMKHYNKPGFWGGATRWPIAELRKFLKQGKAQTKRLDKPIGIRRLIKAVQTRLFGEREIANRPGYVLKPSTKDPRIRRWQRSAPPRLMTGEGIRPLTPEDVKKHAVAPATLFERFLKEFGGSGASLHADKKRFWEKWSPALRKGFQSSRTSAHESDTVRNNATLAFFQQKEAVYVELYPHGPKNKVWLDKIARSLEFAILSELDKSGEMKTKPAYGLWSQRFTVSAKAASESWDAVKNEAERFLLPYYKRVLELDDEGALRLLKKYAGYEETEKLLAQHGHTDAPLHYARAARKLLVELFEVEGRRVAWGSLVKSAEDDSPRYAHAALHVLSHPGKGFDTIGHWGTATANNELAQDIAIISGAEFRPLPDLAPYPVLLRPSRIKKAAPRRARAQSGMAEASREEWPKLYRGMTLPPEYIKWMADGQATEIPLTGCTAFSFDRTIAERYSSSEWTQSKTPHAQAAPVILEIIRDDGVDDTISGWHPNHGRGVKGPAFEVLSGAERFVVESVTPTRLDYQVRYQLPNGSTGGVHFHPQAAGYGHMKRAFTGTGIEDFTAHTNRALAEHLGHENAQYLHHDTKVHPAVVRGKLRMYERVESPQREGRRVERAEAARARGRKGTRSGNGGRTPPARRQGESPSAQLRLVKGAQARLGLVLRPAPTNPQVNRWQRPLWSRAHGRVRLPRNIAHYFASGSSRTSDIEALASMGHDIGVVAGEVIGRAAEKQLHGLKRSMIDVFVDSGAFSEVTFPKDGPPAVEKPMSHKDFDRILDFYVRIARSLGEWAHVVAPDRVGDQHITLQRLATHREKLIEAARFDAEILVPLQRGDMDLVDFWKAAQKALAFPKELQYRLIPTIPMKKRANPAGAVVDFVKRVKPRRLHILGLGLRNRKTPALLHSLVDVHDELEVSLDSNVARSMIGKTGGRGGGARPITALQQELRERGAKPWQAQRWSIPKSLSPEMVDELNAIRQERADLEAMEPMTEHVERVRDLKVQRLDKHERDLLKVLGPTAPQQKPASKLMLRRKVAV